MSRQCRGDSGLTIIEFIVSMAILALALSIAAGAFFAAQAGTKTAAARANQSEQLRVAINQVGEDLSYGNWCCVSNYSPGNGNSFLVAGYQVPLVDKTGWDPAWSTWPGYFQFAGSVLVQYRLEQGQLVRIVYDGYEYIWDPTKSDRSKAYARQVLASGLNPYVAIDDAQGSFFSVDSTNDMIKVVLRSTLSQSGVNAVGEARSEWFLPVAQ